MQTKRMIAAVMSVCMLGGALGYDAPLFEGASVTAGAAETSGACGKDLTWSFDTAAGVLTIKGKGEMTDCPWRDEYKKDIKTVVLPEGLTGIVGNAFYNCTNLTQINIPESVTLIGDSAFRGCTALTGISIPDGVSSIGDYAFRGCSGLTDIYIPEGVASIGDYAFNECKGIKEIRIPAGCAYLGAYALSNCAELKSVIFMSPDTKIETDLSYGIDYHWNIANNKIDSVISTASQSVTVYNTPEFTGTVYGLPGSTAEAFAKGYCAFDSLDSLVTRGDLNSDSMIDGRDATLVLAMYADSSSSGYVPTDEDRAAGDVNNDTFIDGRDATIILAYYADLSSGISIGFEDYLKNNKYI